MAWVLGGAVGIVMPLNGTLGLAVAAAVLAAGWLTTARGLLGSARQSGRTRARGGVTHAAARTRPGRGSRCAR
ncbi:hypothetical protein SGLAM104S_02881 [Streptomyces glaucescens]